MNEIDQPGKSSVQVIDHAVKIHDSDSEKSKASGTDSAASSSTKAPRKVVDKWFKIHPWLIYDVDKNAMFCKTCLFDGIAKN